MGVPLRNLSGVMGMIGFREGRGTWRLAPTMRLQ